MSTDVMILRERTDQTIRVVPRARPDSLRRSNEARSSASSARTGPASRPRCASSRASSPRPTAPPRSTGTTCSTSPLEVRRKHRLPAAARARSTRTCASGSTSGSSPTCAASTSPPSRTRMRKVVEVCGLAQVLGKDISTSRTATASASGSARRWCTIPPILILDEPTSDLDPNEKAEVIKYIKEIGKERTILLSTHNLAEVESRLRPRHHRLQGSHRRRRSARRDPQPQPARSLRRCRSASRSAERGQGARPRTEVQAALTRLAGVRSVTELPTDDKAHAFELIGRSRRRPARRSLPARRRQGLDAPRAAPRFADARRRLPRSHQRRRATRSRRWSRPARRRR